LESFLIGALVSQSLQGGLAGCLHVLVDRIDGCHKQSRLERERWTTNAKMQSRLEKKKVVDSGLWLGNGQTLPTAILSWNQEDYRRTATGWHIIFPQRNRNERRKSRPSCTETGRQMRQGQSLQGQTNKDINKAQIKAGLIQSYYYGSQERTDKPRNPHTGNA
jgi:hypothetical protein